MDPVVTMIELGGQLRPIGSYGVLLAIGMLVGGAIGVRAGVRAGLPAGDLVAVAGFVVGGGLLGAYLLFVGVESFRGTPLDVAFTSGAGLVFYGAPLGGAAAAYFACKVLGVPFGRLADVAIPAVPVAHAIGRLGCFLGGCCFGSPSEVPWAVRYSHPLAPASGSGLAHHPAQLYEAFGLLVIALGFALVPPKEVGRGDRVVAYVLAYACLRFVVEVFRGDAVRGVYFGGTLSTSQLLSIAFAVLAACALFRRRAPAAAARAPSG